MLLCILAKTNYFLRCISYLLLQWCCIAITAKLCNIKQYIIIQLMSLHGSADLDQTQLMSDKLTHVPVLVL